MMLETDRKQASEYAMALDLLVKITQVDTEDQAVENILELFTILFAPDKLRYLTLSDAQAQQKHLWSLSVEDEAAIQKLIASSAREYAWAASGKGFMVKISHKGSLLGIMVVDDIGCPEYKKHYLNLSLSMVAVCGLAIENARRYQRIKKSEDRLRKEKEKVEEALAKVKKLSGLLPICSHCKNIRDDKGYWNQIETYIRDHSETEFSHGICPECADKHYPDFSLYDD
jgi:hypothetical protein